MADLSMLKDANQAVRIFLKYFAGFWIYPVIFGNKTIKMFNFEFSSGLETNDWFFSL